MKNKYTKHYHDPFIHLDQNWKAILEKGYLSVLETAKLSGFTRQHVHKLALSNVIKSHKLNGKIVITCKEFVNWYSSVNISPTSPIGPSSYSLKGLMSFTGRSRSWILNFITRNNVPDYYVGKYRRFCKEESERAWKKEKFKFMKWLKLEDAMNNLHISSIDLYTLVARHLVKTKKSSGVTFFCKADIEKDIRRRNYV